MISISHSGTEFMCQISGLEVKNCGRYARGRQTDRNKCEPGETGGAIISCQSEYWLVDGTGLQKSTVL